MTPTNDDFPGRLRADLWKLQTAVDAAAASEAVSPAAIERLYALLYNTRVKGEASGSGLVSSVSALACGILKRTRSPDQETCRVVKAHVDALAIIIEHEVAGDGGPLGQRMVEELKGLGRAVGA